MLVKFTTIIVTILVVNFTTVFNKKIWRNLICATFSPLRLYSDWPIWSTRLDTVKQAQLKSESNLKIPSKIAFVFACEVYLFDFFTDKIFENQLLPFYYDDSKNILQVTIVLQIGDPSAFLTPRSLHYWRSTFM